MASIIKERGMIMTMETRMGTTAIDHSIKTVSGGMLGNAWRILTIISYVGKLDMSRRIAVKLSIKKLQFQSS